MFLTALKFSQDFERSKPKRTEYAIIYMSVPTARYFRQKLRREDMTNVGKFNEKQETEGRNFCLMGINIPPPLRSSPLHGDSLIRTDGRVGLPLPSGHSIGSGKIVNFWEILNSRRQNWEFLRPREYDLGDQRITDLVTSRSLRSKQEKPALRARKAYAPSRKGLHWSHHLISFTNI